MKLTILTLTFIGCSIFCIAEDAAPSPDEEVSTPSLPAAPPENKTEIDMAAEAIGINYSHLERMALRGNHDALAVIVSLTFDGGAADTMVDVKTHILARCPADEVAAVLEIYSSDFRAKLVEKMRQDFLFINGDKKSVRDEFDRRFGSLIVGNTDKQNKQNKSEMATPRKPSD